MKKLFLEDIKIKTAEEQIKEFVKDMGGVKYVARKMNLSESSIYKSFKKPSDNFKLGMLNLSGKSYDEIIKSPTEQLEYFVDNIFTYAKYYCAEDDIETLLQLKDLSNKYYDLRRSLKIDRAIALYHLYLNEYDLAQHEFNSILAKTIKNKLENEEFIIRAEFSFTKFGRDPIASQKDILEVIKLSEGKNLNNLAYFTMYKLMSTITTANKEFDLAALAIENTLKYASTDFQEALAYFSKGYFEKHTSNFYDAIESYTKALNYFEQNELYIDENFILNNLANCYKEIKDFDKAAEFAERAYLSKHDILESSRFNSHCTCLQVKLRSNNFKNKRVLLSELLNVLIDYSDKYVYFATMTPISTLIKECAIKFDLKDEVEIAEKKLYHKIKYLEKNNLDSSYSKQLLSAFRILIYDIEENCL